MKHPSTDLQSGAATESAVVKISRSTEHQRCPGCGSTSRPVTRRTILLMLEPSLLDQLSDGIWRFCPGAECRVVYFVEDGSFVFTTKDLRVRVGLKEREDPIHLCYCFGFDESHVREEISRTGKCEIPQKISALIKQGLCACETRNPSGACCLGEVIKTVKSLMRT